MSDDFKGLIAKVAAGAALTREEATHAFDRMMSGEATPSQMGGLLMALRVRGETVDEITGAVTTMRAKMLKVDAPPDAIDVVGTGGDASGSFNISTCAAFIVAGAGVPVAKHGNRALSSQSGAADVLGALGVKIELPPRRSAAASTRPASASCSPRPTIRRPRTWRRRASNSARARSSTCSVRCPIRPGVKRQMIGVFSRHWIEPMAHVLKNLGSECVWVAHGSDGLDEITTAGPSYIAALENGAVRTFEVNPEDIGLARAKPDSLRGGDADANATALMAVLKGTKGPFRDIAVLNAAAALIVAGRAKELKEAAALAVKSIDFGEAEGRLDRLIAVSNAQ